MVNEAPGFGLIDSLISAIIWVNFTLISVSMVSEQTQKLATLTHLYQTITQAQNDAEQGLASNFSGLSVTPHQGGNWIQIPIGRTETLDLFLPPPTSP